MNPAGPSESAPSRTAALPPLPGAPGGPALPSVENLLADAVAVTLPMRVRFRGTDARQALLLDESADSPDAFPGAIKNLTFYKEAGVNIVAPPLPYLVALDENNEMVPSAYAKEAQRLGLKMVTWSLERSGPLANVGKGPDYYYATFFNATKKDGDIYKLVDVLAREVGVIGIFSDWSATVTYYANCFGLF